MIGSHIVGNDGITYVDNDATWNSCGSPHTGLSYYEYSLDIEKDGRIYYDPNKGVDWDSCGRYYPKSRYQFRSPWTNNFNGAYGVHRDGSVNYSGDYVGSDSCGYNISPHFVISYDNTYYVTNIGGLAANTLVYSSSGGNSLRALIIKIMRIL